MYQAVALLSFVTLQRVLELIWARHNTARLIACGAVEFGRKQYPWLVALHASWLAGLWVAGYDRSLQPAFIIAFVLLQCGRLWVLFTLGPRWTTRIIAVPNTLPVARGPYRFIKHPNYLIVAGEIAVVPMALGLPAFATLFFLLNCLVLLIRIPTENRALAWAAGKHEEGSRCVPTVSSTD